MPKRRENFQVFFFFLNYQYTEHKYCHQDQDFCLVLMCDSINYLFYTSGGNHSEKAFDGMTLYPYFFNKR